MQPSPESQGDRGVLLSGSTRDRGAESRLSAAAMNERGCTAEGIALILALYELIDARYESVEHFVDAVMAEAGDAAVVNSVQQFSSQMGDGGSYTQGPDWGVAHAVVASCSPQWRRVMDLARIAGLWASAHGHPRPQGYTGPVFPVETHPNLMEHLRSLTRGVQPVFTLQRRCQRTIGRKLVLSLVTVGLLWLAVWFVFDVDFGLPEAGRATDRPLTGGEWWSIAFALMLTVIPTIVVISPECRSVPLRPSVSSGEPSTLPANDIDLSRHYGIERPMLPRQRKSGGDLIWSLPPGAAYSTQLAVHSKWAARHSIFARALARSTCCLRGELGLGSHRTGNAVPQIEWSLCDDSGRMHATGILPVPVENGYAVPVSFPGDDTVLRERLYLGDMERRGVTDEWLADVSFRDLLDAVISGELQWSPSSKVTLVLRRLDSGTQTVKFRWTRPGMHIHWGRRQRRVQPLSRTVIRMTITFDETPESRGATTVEWSQVEDQGERP